MKIALVHDFLFEYAGSERVVEQILRVFPQADLFTLFDFLAPERRFGIGRRRVRTTFMQSFSFLKRNPAGWLPLVVPLMPLAMKRLDLSGYDLVLSSSHSFAKGVRTAPQQLHISYVHAAMRFAWERQADYLHTGIQAHWPVRWITRGLLSSLRSWDARTVQGVNHFIANSQYISRCIQKNYHRDSRVVYPPVDLSGFDLCEAKDEYYLVISRLVPYKRVDLIVQAFTHLPGRRLVVIGGGPELGRLRQMAGQNVQFLGYQEPSALQRITQHARALVIAAVEDFGIAPVEAQACGTPVIALRQGGAAETVIGLDHLRPTGLFYNDQDVASIRAAIIDFEKVKDQISPLDCRKNALHYSPARFRQEYCDIVTGEWTASHAGLFPWPIQPEIREESYG
ncbi:MAG: glycosyltransferase [Anaerolineaceae bacterium]|nr:glycosyltransferase [Anaerolineaceae bacterium]